MRRILVVLLAAVSLTGCAQYEAQRQAEAQAQAAAINAHEDRVCQSYGAAPGSNPYIQCRMNLSNQRAQIQANDRAIAMQYLLWSR